MAYHHIEQPGVFSIYKFQRFWQKFVYIKIRDASVVNKSIENKKNLKKN